MGSSGHLFLSLTRRDEEGKNYRMKLLCTGQLVMENPDGI